jgi:hypothetical protein
VGARLPQRRLCCRPHRPLRRTLPRSRHRRRFLATEGLATAPASLVKPAAPAEGRSPSTAPPSRPT